MGYPAWQKRRRSGMVPSAGACTLNMLRDCCKFTALRSGHRGALPCPAAVSAKRVSDHAFPLNWSGYQNDGLDLVKFYFDTTIPAQDSAHQTTNGGHIIEVHSRREQVAHETDETRYDLSSLASKPSL